MKSKDIIGPYVRQEIDEGVLADLAKKFMMPIAMSFVVTGAKAGPVLTPAVYETTFNDTESAVVYISDKFNQESKSTDKEFMGYVIDCPDGHRVTYAEGQARTGEISIRIAIPKECTLTAVWHTHGSKGKHKHYFSPNDIAIAEQLNVPIYMIDPDDVIRKFSKGDRVRSAVGRNPERGVGKVVRECSLDDTILVVDIS